MVTPIPIRGIARSHFKAQIIRIQGEYGPNRRSFDIPTIASHGAIEFRRDAFAANFANARGPIGCASAERPKKDQRASGRERAKLRSQINLRSNHPRL